MNFKMSNSIIICVCLLYRRRCLYEGRNSGLHMFFKLSVLKIFKNFTGKHMCWRLLLIKLLALRPETLLRRTPAPASYCETFKNTFFRKHFWWLLLERLGEVATLVKVSQDCGFNIFRINCRCFKKMLIMKNNE